MCEYCEMQSTSMAEKNNHHFPFEIKDVELEMATELLTKAVSGGFVGVGPKGYFFPKKYESEAALYYNMAVRPSDVFVNTFPRSGTTLTQELVWLIGNEFDYEKAADLNLEQRFPYLEKSTFHNPTRVNALMEKFKENEKALKELRVFYDQEAEHVCNMPSPRFIKTLPLSLLPPDLAETARVVYVARDPRDVAVSFYHLKKTGLFTGYNGDFKTYWNYFIKDLIVYSPYFEHIKEGWEKRHHPNVLFLFYEEIRKDLPGNIRKVAKILDKVVTVEQVEKLTDHLKINNFKKNKAVNYDYLHDIGFAKPDGQSFIRKGKVGGWRDYFDEEMTRQAQHWIAGNLRGTDLRFPGMDEP